MVPSALVSSSAKLWVQGKKRNFRSEQGNRKCNKPQAKQVLQGPPEGLSSSLGLAWAGLHLPGWNHVCKELRASSLRARFSAGPFPSDRLSSALF